MSLQLILGGSGTGKSTHLRLWMRRFGKELAVINFEIAQMTVAADGAEALPDWFMMEIIRDLPRLVS